MEEMNMKKIITTMAESASEALTKTRAWYETLEIPLLRAPVASKYLNSDQVYRVVVWVDQ
ncbi:MAG: hypothetical protein WCQ65_09385 [Fermentimonas sp.]